MLRANPDPRLRQIERRYSSGDVSAAGELAVEQLRSTGALDANWIGLLVQAQDPAIVFVRDALYASGAAEALNSTYGAELYRRFVDVVLEETQPNDGTPLPPVNPDEVIATIPPELGNVARGFRDAQDRNISSAIFTPNRFGEITGQILSVAFYGNYADRLTLSNYGATSLGRRRARVLEPERYFLVQAADRYRPNSDIHPLYYYANNGGPGRGAPRTPFDPPARIETATILQSELVAGGPDALGLTTNLVTTGPRGIDTDFAQVDNLLRLTEQDTGIPLARGTDEECFLAAMDYCSRVDSMDHRIYQKVRRALYAVRPPARPELGADLFGFFRWPFVHDFRNVAEGQPVPMMPDPKVDFRALNASGEGLLHQALIGLGAYLRSAGAVVELSPTLSPFNSYSHGSPHMVRSSLFVRSRRAKSTRHPLVVELTFDIFAGHLAHLGDHWSGNAYDPDGLWHIGMSSRTPRTVLDYVQLIEPWIRDHFPRSTVLSHRS